MRLTARENVAPLRFVCPYRWLHLYRHSRRRGRFSSAQLHQWSLPMRHFSRPWYAALAIAAAAGCSDSTSPGTSSARQIGATDRPSLDYDGPSRFGGVRTTTFTLTARGGTYEIGDVYTLTVPANAVCKLNSGYGPGTWDLPCATLDNGESIRITARYAFTKSGPVVDFSPDLRFSPQAQVTLATDLYAQQLSSGRGYFNANPAALRNFGIRYTSDMGATNIADATADQSLVTHINLRSGKVWRRVKHFSGYNVASGRECDPSPDDPDCIAGPAPEIDGR